MNASAVVEPAVLKHASARFGSPTPRTRSARRGRMIRCRRSRVAPSMTNAFDSVGCSMFLNNRYMDPQTGVFVSVDPMVSMTGQPYHRCRR